MYGLRLLEIRQRHGWFVCACTQSTLQQVYACAIGTWTTSSTVLVTKSGDGKMTMKLLLTVNMKKAMKVSDVSMRSLSLAIVV